jgi:hypothetical protein
VPDEPESTDEDEPDRCVKCGEPSGKDGRWYSDGTGELVPYCAECAEQELGSLGLTD